MPKESSDANDNKVLAAIAYISFLFIVPLLVAQQSEFAKYHAKQGLILFVAEVILSFIMVVPFLGWVIAPIGWIIAVIFSLIGILNALGEKKVPLPLIGKYAENIKL